MIKYQSCNHQQAYYARKSDLSCDSKTWKPCRLYDSLSLTSQAAKTNVDCKNFCH